MKPEMIVEVIGALVSVASVFAVAWIGRRQMYVDLVAKKRLESVDERRETLKKLYLYTNPEYIARIDNPEEYIGELLELQSALEYRLMEQLDPEKDILKEVRKLVELLVNIVKQGYDKDDSEWFTKHDKDKKFEEKRSKCLGLLKIYNFASWKFVQKQAMGRKVDSIKAFNDCYEETEEELGCDKLKNNKKLYKEQKKNEKM